MELLRAPARAHPTSLAGQLRYVREHWRGLLGADLDALLDRMLLTLDVIAEEDRGLHLRFGGGGDGGRGGGRGEAPDLTGLDAEPERFSRDSAWMPRLVLVAKSTHVWLDQLSRRYSRDIRTLDAIPDEELDRLARWGITGLWLIGLWERSQRVAQRIKELARQPGRGRVRVLARRLRDRGRPRRRGGLGGPARTARGRAASGSASDMVPNHMGIDSRWVIEHPEWFLSLPEPPYPAYPFSGENLAEHDRRRDPARGPLLGQHATRPSCSSAATAGPASGATSTTATTARASRGTTPRSSTSRSADVREQVIQTILDVARRFPVIRFDAAMMLAKRTSSGSGSRPRARAAGRSRRAPSTGR